MSTDVRTPSAAIPQFKAPPSRITDPPLPTVETSPEGTTTSTTTGTQAPNHDAAEASPRPSLRRFLPGAASPSDLQSRGLLSASGDRSSADTPTSTDRRPPGGNPNEVGKTIAGLIAILTGFIAVRAARRNARFRIPTPDQRDAIAMPIGAILCRHLPMDMLGPDIADAAKAAAATQNYVMDGPLLTRMPAPENPLES